MDTLKKFVDSLESYLRYTSNEEITISMSRHTANMVVDYVRKLLKIEESLKGNGQSALTPERILEEMTDETRTMDV